MSKDARFHSRVGRVLQCIGCRSERLDREEGQTYRDTLESKAKSSAASPYTFSPLFSLSISNPPSYRPMSRPGGTAPFTSEGGAGNGFDLVSLVVMGCRKDDDDERFVFEAGKGFGAANLVRSFATFV